MNPSDWKKTCEKVVDQRDVELPPTWIARQTESPRVEELGRAVHISGRRRQVAQRLSELLGAAQKHAIVSSFLLADKGIEDAMMEAAQRGVRVYVQLASEARLGREESDGEFDRRVLAQHKEMLARLAGHVLFRSAPHFHAKMVLVDPWDSPQGVLLTANLTSEALERNEELAVDLSHQEVREAAALLGWAMWETAEHEMVDPEDRFRAVKPMNALDHPGPGATLLATTSERTELHRRALEVIDSASKRLTVASFGWEKDHAVVQRLCERARDGLAVTVLARCRLASMPALLRLCQAGATVRGFRWLHAKAIWSDSGQALVMSANLQTEGLDRGFELGVHLDEDRAAELCDRLNTWAAVAPWQLEQAPTLGSVRGAAMVWDDRQFTEVEVEASVTVPLGEHTSASADDLTIDTPALPPDGALPRMAHEVRCTWVVSAPMLQGKAKEVYRPGEGKGERSSYAPPVFKEGGGRRVVVVTSPDELQAAKRLKAEVTAAAIVVRGEVLR